MVGIVVTISPNFSLYNMVVLPAASRPTGKRKIFHIVKAGSYNAKIKNKKK